MPITATFDWRSPRALGFAEFRDGEALAQLGVQLSARPLSDFWPARGPVWDGLARASTGEVFLCEAKAHVPEMISGGSKAGDESLKRIRASLDAVRVAIATGNACVDWATGPFFQYANRLSFLHLLRVQNAIPAHLVFVCFLNAVDVRGPSDRAAYGGQRRSSSVASACMAAVCLSTCTRCTWTCANSLCRSGDAGNRQRRRFCCGPRRGSWPHRDLGIPRVGDWSVSPLVWRQRSVSARLSARPW